MYSEWTEVNNHKKTQSEETLEKDPNMSDSDESWEKH